MLGGYIFRHAARARPGNRRHVRPGYRTYRSTVRPRHVRICPCLLKARAVTTLKPTPVSYALPVAKHMHISYSKLAGVAGQRDVMREQIGRLLIPCDVATRPLYTVSRGIVK